MTCPAALCLARSVSITNTRRQKWQSCKAVVSSVHYLSVLLARPATDQEIPSPHQQAKAHAWVFDQAVPLIGSAGLPQSHGHLAQVAVEMRNFRMVLPWSLKGSQCHQAHITSLTTPVLPCGRLQIGSTCTPAQKNNPDQQRAEHLSERKSRKLGACLPLPARGQTDALRGAKLGHQGQASKATTAAPATSIAKAASKGSSKLNLRLNCK